MVRFIATASAVFYFINSSNTANAFAPVTPISRKCQTAQRVNVPTKSKTHPRIASMEQRAVPLPTISLAVDTVSLTQYLLETLISNGVPAFFFITIIAFAAKSIKSAKEAGSQTNGGLFG